MAQNNEVLESYLQEMEYEIRQSVPGWDEGYLWKFAITEKPISKREMIDYDNKTVWVGGETLKIACSGNKDIREEMLSYLFSIIRVMRMIDP